MLNFIFGLLVGLIVGGTLGIIIVAVLTAKDEKNDESLLGNTENKK